MSEPIPRTWEFPAGRWNHDGTPFRPETREMTFTRRGGRVTTPNPGCEEHTQHPSGYVAHAEWRERMLKTHRCRQCRGCGLWTIWEPK